MVVDAIRRAVAFTRDGQAAAIVTNPINKAVLKAAGFGHPGHTEFLQLYPNRVPAHPP